MEEIEWMVGGRDKEMEGMDEMEEGERDGRDERGGKGWMEWKRGESHGKSIRSVWELGEEGVWI